MTPSGWLSLAEKRRIGPGRYTLPAALCGAGEGEHGAPGGNRLLTYLLAFLGGVAGALLGWIVTGFLADFVLGLQGMSEREGGRAMVAFFTVAPFGALAGLILGVWLVLRYQGGYRGFANLAGRGALVIAGIGAAVALGLWVYIGSDDILVKNGPPPQAKFEIRLPANTVPANLEGLSVDLNTTRNTMPATLGGARNEGGRPVIPGEVDLYFRTTSRILVLRVPGEPERLFVLKLAGNPGAQAEFGPWQRVDYIDDQPQQAPRKGGEGDDSEIRYRVERAD